MEVKVAERGCVFCARPMTVSYDARNAREGR